MKFETHGGVDYWRASINQMRWSDIAKAYARCNAIVISSIVGCTLYGFRDISTGATIVESMRGVTSYRALYVAMLKYVATKRGGSK